MTDNIRKVGRVIVLAFLMYMLAGLVLLIVGAVLSLDPVLIGVAIILLGTLGVVYWIFRDARNTAAQLRLSPKEHRPEPGPDGDMSDVAGIPRRDPWLG
jgi:hypothetical protein